MAKFFLIELGFEAFYQGSGTFVVERAMEASYLNGFPRDPYSWALVLHGTTKSSNSIQTWQLGLYDKLKTIQVVALEGLYGGTHCLAML